MTLNEFNGLVEGTYSHDGGVLKGEVGGNKLFADWNETPTRKGPKDAGKLEFTMSDDGMTFTGRWNYDGDPRWRNNWSGTRVTPIEEDPAECKAAKRKARKATQKIAEIKALIRELNRRDTPSPGRRAMLRDRLNAAKSTHATLKALADEACQ